MGKPPIKVNLRQITPFLQSVRKKFNPQQMILFGSRARGEALKFSDYDLLIISSAFSKYNFYQRMVEVYHLQKVPVAIEVICLTPAEFKARRNSLGIIQEAVREGVDITAAS